MSGHLIYQNRRFIEQMIRPSKAEDRAGFELACFLSKRHFQENLDEGARLIISKIPTSPRFHEFTIDWNHFIHRIRALSTTTQSTNEKEEGAWQAIQHALGVSERLMQEFYLYGAACYHQFEYEDSLAIMGFISILNPLFFEPWLVQALIHIQTEDQADMALFCATMAALLRFDHPAPHLLMAKAYHLQGDREMALHCMGLGSEKLLATSEPQWNQFFDNLKKELRS